MRDIQITPEAFDEDYYLNGVQSGKSLYENYRYLPEMTIPMCRRIIDHCGIVRGDKILDYGCARGYIVKALLHLEHDAYGIDCSKWATDNADEEIKKRIACSTRVFAKYDWIIVKDVLEHVAQLREAVDNLMQHARKGIFVVVPLSEFNGYPYVVPEYERDVTHVHRLNMTAWIEQFIEPGWQVTAQYRLEGVKDNYKGFDKGNAFLVARRIA